jgi:hypothetical protein
MESLILPRLSSSSSPSSLPQCDVGQGNSFGHERQSWLRRLPPRTRVPCSAFGSEVPILLGHLTQGGWKQRITAGLQPAMDHPTGNENKLVPDLSPDIPYRDVYTTGGWGKSDGRRRGI